MWWARVDAVSLLDRAEVAEIEMTDYVDTDAINSALYAAPHEPTKSRRRIGRRPWVEKGRRSRALQRPSATTGPELRRRRRP
jgi:hypothetical protein